MVLIFVYFDERSLKLQKKFVFKISIGVVCYASLARYAATGWRTSKGLQEPHQIVWKRGCVKLAISLLCTRPTPYVYIHKTVPTVFVDTI